VLYWPQAQFGELRRRWPDGQDSHTEHRREVERTLRERVAGNTPSVVRGDVSDFEEFCSDRALDPSQEESHTRYAAHLEHQGHGAPWPPGRNEP
jgi:hypothetical protein